MFWLILFVWLAPGLLLGLYFLSARGGGMPSAPQESSASAEVLPEPPPSSE